MKTLLFAIAASMVALGGAVTAHASSSSGIDFGSLDADVRPQDDFYSYVNGKWLAATEIPADPDQQKIADFYASFMDEVTLQPLGWKPLTAEFARIDALRKIEEVPGLITHFNRLGGLMLPTRPRSIRTTEDSTKYAFDLGQSDLGLPDRDYYLGSEAQLRQTREKYVQHIERMLVLGGAPPRKAKADAKSIMALETALASIQWTKVELRDPSRTANRGAGLDVVAPYSPISLHFTHFEQPEPPGC